MRTMPLQQKDVAEECGHSGLEHLGNNRDARFIRCESCGRVFVLQDGRTWTLPALRSRLRPVDESG